VGKCAPGESNGYAILTGDGWVGVMDAGLLKMVDLH
jgi:hypothetical protein